MNWQAHGLSYGIPADVLTNTQNGQHYIANLSRGVLQEAANKFPEFVVIQLTASIEILAQRLALRGRECEDVIANRLARSTFPMPEGLNIHLVNNKGRLDDTVNVVVELLQNKRSPGV